MFGFALTGVVAAFLAATNPLVAKDYAQKTVAFVNESSAVLNRKGVEFGRQLAGKSVVVASAPAQPGVRELVANELNRDAPRVRLNAGSTVVNNQAAKNASNAVVLNAAYFDDLKVRADADDAARAATEDAALALARARAHAANGDM